jgi:hypothetical protein
MNSGRHGQAHKARVQSTVELFRGQIFHMDDALGDNCHAFSGIFPFHFPYLLSLPLFISRTLILEEGREFAVHIRVQQKNSVIFLIRGAGAFMLE